MVAAVVWTPGGNVSASTRGTSLRWIKPVRAFVVVSAAHHFRTERARDCLAAASPASRLHYASAAPTCSTLPDCGVSITRRTKVSHRLTRPAATVLPRLAVVYVSSL